MLFVLIRSQYLHTTQAALMQDCDILLIHPGVLFDVISRNRFLCETCDWLRDFKNKNGAQLTRFTYQFFTTLSALRTPQVASEPALVGA